MKMCHCGRPLHYQSKRTEAIVEKMCAQLGDFIEVHYEGGTWLVQRHYIALHGLRGLEIPRLGFRQKGGPG